MPPIVVCIKSVAWRGWSLYFRVGINKTPKRPLKWKRIDGHWQPFGSASTDGYWDYAAGLPTVYDANHNSGLELSKVHWNFEAICMENELTGKGISPAGVVTWIMGTPQKHDVLSNGIYLDSADARRKISPPGSQHFRIRWLNRGKGTVSIGKFGASVGVGRFEFQIIDDDRHLRATYNLDARVTSGQIPDLPFAPSPVFVGAGPFQAFTTKVPVTLQDFERDALLKTEFGDKSLTLSGPSIVGHTDPIPIPTDTPKIGFDGKPVKSVSSEFETDEGPLKLVGVSKVLR